MTIIHWIQPKTGADRKHGFSGRWVEYRDDRNYLQPHIEFPDLKFEKAGGMGAVAKQRGNCVDGLPAENTTGVFLVIVR